MLINDNYRGRGYRRGDIFIIFAVSAGADTGLKKRQSQGVGTVFAPRFAEYQL